MPSTGPKRTEHNNKSSDNRRQALTEIADALNLAKDDGSDPGPTTFVTAVIRAWRDGGRGNLTLKLLTLAAASIPDNWNPLVKERTDAAIDTVKSMIVIESFEESAEADQESGK